MRTPHVVRVLLALFSVSFTGLAACAAPTGDSQDAEDREAAAKAWSEAEARKAGIIEPQFGCHSMGPYVACCGDWGGSRETTFCCSLGPSGGSCGYGN
jgi:hypothetical protein